MTLKFFPLGMRELSPVIISVFWGHSLFQSLIHPFVTDQILALISWFPPLGVALTHLPEFTHTV